ncbi:MAG TPA: MerR family transcriptional regulator [Armatimonadota bacterium]|nr:MerR family transcriptional regulator [Armatimonadota bacterium]HOS43489.1 MerR family transcriptional regulator [Armatimonadota bacterium]
MRLNSRTTGKNSLAPIDAEELLLGLKLTTGKAAEFCDISRRQLCYWTDKGIIETLEGDGELEEQGEDGARRVYDFTALRKVLLIKQLLEQGRGLKRATREVESYLQQREDEELEADADRRTREDILQRLTARLEELAEQVRMGVQRGRIPPAELRRLAHEVLGFMELLTYDDSATMQLQEDVNAINQFRAMLDQLALDIDAKVVETPGMARRALR